MKETKVKMFKRIEFSRTRSFGFAADQTKQEQHIIRGKNTERKNEEILMPKKLVESQGEFYRIGFL